MIWHWFKIALAVSVAVSAALFAVIVVCVVHDTRRARKVQQEQWRGLRKERRQKADENARRMRKAARR